MMLNRTITAAKVCLVITGLSGCVTLNNLEDVADVVDSLPTDGTLSCKLPTPRAVESEVSLVGKKVKDLNRETIPNSLSKSTVPDKILATFRTQIAESVVTPRGAEGTRVVTFKRVSRAEKKKLQLTSGELEDFFDSFAKTILDPSTYTGLKQDGKSYDTVSTEGEGRDTAVDAQGRAVSDPSLDPNRHNLAHVFKAYYLEYIRGKYVDRTGTQFKKPEIKKSIGNDVISAALMIFLDAISDSQISTPVFKKDGKYYPAETTTEPTSAAKKIVRVLDLSSNSDECGITEPEARAIGFLSNLAGDKSALLSGLVLQSFAHVHASFIVGGNFAVGDNETFATLVKTTLEVVSRRAVEEGAYEFFWAYQYKIGNSRAVVAGGRTFIFSGTYNTNAIVEGRAAAPDTVAAGREKLDGVARFLEDFQ